MAAYLPTNGTITGIQSNLGAYQGWANTRITTIDANLGSATTNITTLFSNAAGQANQITGANTAIVTANSAVVSFVGTINNNLSTAITANTNAANAAIITANTGLKSYVDTQDSAITTAWTANAATQATSLNVLDANLGTATTNITTLFSNAAGQANQITGANAAIVTANSAVVSFVGTINNNLSTAITANTNAANAAIVTANSAVVSFVGTINNNLSTAITANTNAANTAATTANTNMKSYVDTQDSAITTAWTANAATQAASINSINANIGAYYQYANANLGTATTNITTLFSNAATQATSLNSINANIGAYYQYANANLGTATTNITNLQSNAGSQQTQINSIVTNANANVAAYLPTYSGSLGGTLTTAAQTNITSVGTLTGLTSSGIVNITNSTQSNDNTTGALVVTGGAAVGANLHVGGSLHVTGNLEVNGTQTIFNTNVSVIEDSMIYLGDDNTGDSVDIGLVSSFTNPGYQHTGFVRDASDGVWKLFANVVAEPTTIVDFTSATYSNLRIGALTASSAAYSGTVTVDGNLVVGGNVTLGNLLIDDTELILFDTADPTKKAQFNLSGLTTNNSVVYNLPPGSANVSTLVDLVSTQTINGGKTFSSANQNFGSSTGAGTQQFAYGATTTGLTKTINIGTGGAQGSFTNMTIGPVLGYGNVTFQGNAPVLITNTSASTSSTTGALEVLGGVGIVGNLNVDGTTNYFAGIVMVGTPTSSNDYRVDIAPQSSGAALRLRGGSGGTSYLQFTDSGISTSWGFLETSSGSHNISHNQIVRFTTASTERVRIAADGKVGIGTISPAQNLHVASTTDAVALVTGGSASAGYVAVNGNARSSLTGATILLSYSSGAAELTNKSNAALVIGTNDTERVRITADGNVVVTSTTTSTSSTTGALVVAGGTGIASNVTVGGNILMPNSSTTASYIQLGPALKQGWDGSGTQISGTGYVFLNQSGATYSAQVINARNGLANDAGTKILTISSVSQLSVANTMTSTSTTTGALLVSGGAGIAGNLNVGGTVNYFSGSVGINTTTPANKFEVYGDSLRSVARGSTTTGSSTIEAQTNDYWSLPSYTGTGLVQNGNAATGTSAGVSNANLGILRFQNGSAGLIYTNGGAPLVFGTTSTERMRISSAGNVTITVNTASTTTTTGALVVAGGVGVAGQITVGNIVTTSGVYWANGAAYSSGSGGGGITYTASATAPVSPSAGNFWYDTSTDIKYQYINDGSSSYWVDQSYPTSFGNLTVANTLTVSGSIVGTTTNANYSLAANVSLYESVTATTTNATHYPMLSGITSGNTASFTASGLTFNPSTGNLVVGGTTTSTSTTTGALVVGGGVGIAGNINVGGNISVYNAPQTWSLPGSLSAAASHQWIRLGTFAAPQTGAHLAIKMVLGSGYNASIAQNSEAYIHFKTSNGASVDASGFAGDVSYYLTGASSTALTGVKAVGSAAGVSATSYTLYANVGSYAGSASFYTVETSGPSYGVSWTNQSAVSTDPGVASNTVCVASKTLTFNTGTYFGGHVLPTANLTYDLGSTTAWWNNMYGVSVQAKYADLAEHYTADADYVPGTVVVFGGTEEITTSNISHDPRVAGVISTDPAYLMNAANPGLPVALTGRVPCQVQGPVAKGDRLVNINTGVAGRLDPALHEYGCIIGKSLGEITDDSIQTIEIVVGRF